jgi:hypothetical protein
MNTTSPKRRWLTVVVLTLVLGLGACSILQFVYNQAPKYLLWRSNRAFHYNDTQYVMAKSSMRHWFQWQRQAAAEQAQVWEEDFRALAAQ